MDYLIKIDSMNKPQMTFNAANSIVNNIILSLAVKKGAFFLDPDFGSRLFEIKTASDQNILLAQRYAKDALVWLIKIDKLSSVDVSAKKISDGIILHIYCILKDGKTISYQYFHRVV